MTLSAVMILLLVAGTAFAQSSTSTAAPGDGGGGYPPCSICGKGKVVSKPQGKVFVSNTKTIRCSAYDKLGEDGLFQPAECEIAYLLAGDCGCKSKTMSTGWIVEIILGVVAFLVIAAVIMWVAFRRRCKQQQRKNMDGGAAGRNTTITVNQYAACSQTETTSLRVIPVRIVAESSSVRQQRFLNVPHRKQLGVEIDGSVRGVPAEMGIVTETSTLLT